MQQLFENNNHIIFTQMVSDKEYCQRILRSEPTENLVKYYDDITEKILKEYFDVKKCPNKHIWFGEWHDHRRMAIKLHQFYSHEVRFGYNYDFIPILNSQDKFVYHRTDKAVNLDVMDLYFNHISYQPDKMTYSESFHVRRKYELPQYGGEEELDFAKKYIEDVIRTNIIFMQEFYGTYQTDEHVIEYLNSYTKLNDSCHVYQYIWTKAFLYAKLQDMDKAISAMGDYYEHRNREIPERVMEKLEAVKEMFQ